MKPGTIIELENGRKGTTVYHNIDGFGIIWGEKKVNADNLPEPEAMLRDDYSNAKFPCVGTNYKIIKEGSYE